MKAQVTLTPAESKRLIGKAVASMDEVKKALKKGIVIIALGTTNAYVAEEILGKKLNKSLFAAGIVTPRGTCHTPPDKRAKEIVIKKGKVAELRLGDVLSELGSEDVFIKGANALDPEGHAAVFTADPYGGTVGKALGVVMARGVHYIVPVGLEKLVPNSLKEASKKVGTMKIDISMGTAIGLTLAVGRIVTEIEALKILAEVEAISLGAGGIGGAEGAVTLLLEGDEDKVTKAWKIIIGLKGEKKLEAVSAGCEICTYNCTYRPKKQ